MVLVVMIVVCMGVRGGGSGMVVDVGIEDRRGE